MHVRFDLTLPCYCSAVRKIALLALNYCLALGFQPNGYMPDLILHCPASVLLLRRVALPALNCCLALGFQPTGLVPIFELELPYYYSSVDAKSRFACINLLFGPGRPTERVYARLGLKLPRHRSAAAISRFFCTELLGLLLVLLTTSCSQSLWVVLNVTCLTL